MTCYQLDICGWEGGGSTRLSGLARLTLGQEAIRREGGPGRPVRPSVLTDPSSLPSAGNTQDTRSVVNTCLVVIRLGYVCHFFIFFIYFL